MKLSNYIIILLSFSLLVFFGLARPVFAATETSLYNQAQASKTRLERSKKAQKYRHNWENVIKRYEKVIKKNSRGKYAARSLLTIGDLYRGLHKRSRVRADLTKSLEYYNRLVKNHPKNPFAAKGQLMIGHVYYYTKKDNDRAFIEYLKVELNHANSKLTLEAQKQMGKISGIETKAAKQKARAKIKEEKKPASQGKKNGDNAIIQSVRHWSTPFYTRVVIDLDHKIDYTDHMLRPDPKLKKPMRLYLDLKKSRIGPDTSEVLPITNRLLRQVRLAQYNQNTVRVVLDIESIENYRIFALKDPFRIVIDVSGKSKNDGRKTAKNTGSKTGLTTGSKKDTGIAKPLTDLRATAKNRKKVPRGKARINADKTSLIRQLGLGVRKVVIDPGHGGKDNGASSRSGLKEKDLALKVSKLVASKVRNELGLKCVLTRETDVFLPLEERTAIANTSGADLFISIHANAHKDRSINGLETYFLNLATDKEAMRVAARENATTTKNMSDLEVILSDLMLNSKITESSRMALAIQTQMVRHLRKKYKNVRNMGVKQAPFYVLIGANMPSILVEIAFITNKVEEKRVKEQKYIEALADGIIQGIREYSKSVKTAGYK